MRKWLPLALMLLVLPASGQVWEKLLRPGLNYRMEVDETVPRVVHVLRYRMGAPEVTMRVDLADTRVYNAGETRGRLTLSQIVNRTGAVAAMNGDFFPFTGDPLGAMVRDGELLSRPWPRRAVFGWGSDFAGTAILDFSGRVEFDASEPLRLDGLNEDCPENTLTLNTEAAGIAFAKAPNLMALIRLEGDGRLTPQGTLTGNFVSLTADQTSREVPPGHVVLAARGATAAPLRILIPGQRVRMSVKMSGFDWTRVNHVIGGGPFLVRGGQPFIDWEAQGFKAGFANNRHPRTAIGRTADGDLLLVTVDGRQETSAGATLAELATVMIRLGATEAINLDGGGSTTFSLDGRTINRPSEGAERAISNALLFVGPRPMATVGELAIQGPRRVVAGTRVTYVVIGPDGQPLPNASVVWSATGGAWVDQGGTVRGLRAGNGTLTASVTGQLVTLPIAIEAAAPARPANPTSRKVPPTRRRG